MAAAGPATTDHGDVPRPTAASSWPRAEAKTASRSGRGAQDCHRARPQCCSGAACASTAGSGSAPLAARTVKAMSVLRAAPGGSAACSVATRTACKWVGLAPTFSTP